MGKEITNEQLFEFMTKIYSDLDGKIVMHNGDRFLHNGDRFLCA